jgi:ketosteroid isomerase-like protein
MKDAQDEGVIILPRMRRRARDGSWHPARRLLAAALALATFACASLRTDSAREELADAERAFAADCAARGIRASFIDHFAPDGLAFEPAPTRVRETWPARPAGVRLAWHPELVEVARAADLGYSTGPFELTDAARNRTVHGVFFSVWQRQADGQWKVWLDLGARTGAPADAAAWSRRPRVRDEPQAQDHATATAVSEADRELSGLDPERFARRLATDARRQQDDSPPLVGAAWTGRLADEGAHVDYTPSEARVSASGDFAASYGSVLVHGRDNATTRGHYVHVWLRDNGAWWLAAESLVMERS